MLNPPKNKKPFVSIVIPTLNEADNINACLRSLTKLNYPSDRYEVIVVDNGSTDRTQDIVEEYDQVKLYIFANVNVGAVRNYGAKVARGEILAFIDGDCLAPINWLLTGLSAMEENHVKVIGGTVLIKKDLSWVERSWVSQKTYHDGPTYKLIGASIIIDREVFLSVKGFNEDIKAGEDSLLAHTLTNNGYDIYFKSDCSIIHLGYQTTLFEFVAKQYWQASSYINSNIGLFNDYMFIGVITFITLGVSSVIFLIMYPNIGINMLIITLVLPMLLTVRRVIKSSRYTVNIFSYIQMYIIDLAYLTGRSLGLISSVLMSLIFNKRGNISRL